MKKRKMLRREILLFTVTAMLLVAALIAMFSVSLYRQYSLLSRLEAASYSLGTGKASLERFVQEFGEFRLRVQSSPVIQDYLLNPYSSIRKLKAYAFLEEDYHRLSGSAWYYRVAVVPVNGESLAQVGSALVTAHVIKPGDILSQITDEERHDHYSEIRLDATLPPFAGQVLPTVLPVYDYVAGNKLLGWLYIEIGIEELLNSTPPFGDGAYLQLGEDVYRNQQGRLERTELQLQRVRSSDPVSTSYKTEGGYLVLTNGDVYEEDIALALLVPAVLSNEVYFLLLLLLGILLAVAAAGAVCMYLLHRMFSAPVERIREKTLRIAEGDYSRDLSIETDNEFGDIGRGLNDLAEKLEAKIRQSVEDERKRQELEYRMLQSQINPHFMNNTLNAIKMMATMQGAKGISEMTTSLARLMKHIAKSGSSLCMLSDELLLLDDYFTIFNYRYGGTVSFQKDIQEETLTAELPKFSLQPIVENAIFHGIEPKGGIGTITLTARAKEGKTEICIIDDGVGMDKETVAGLLKDSTTEGGMFRSIGLRNVSERIEYTYGKGYGITQIESEPGAGTCVTVTLPGRKDEIQSDNR